MWPFLTYIGCITLWFLLLGCLIFFSSSPLIRRFAWGVSGGSLSGNQNFIKDSLTLLKAANNKNTADTIPVGLFCGLFFLAIFAAFTGLLLLTACMKRYDATYSAAMYVGSFVITASVMSVIHYDTFWHLESLDNQIMYPTGLAILMGGVYLLATEKHEEQTRSRLALSRSPSESSIVMVVRSDTDDANDAALSDTEDTDDSYNDLV